MVATQLMVMHPLRRPLLPVGLVLVALGAGNWYTGSTKSLQYEQLLAARNQPAPVADSTGFRELTARTTLTLLSNLDRGTDDFAVVNAKLDFYKVVQSGGRLLILLGLFSTAAGLIRSWYQQHVTPPAR